MNEIKKSISLWQLNDNYLSFLGKFKEIEITPDIIIFGYEIALKENQYLHENYPEISEKVWIIGRTGQGDEWFVNKTKNNILFYDHNQGEYLNINQFLDMKINFENFLKMAFSYQQLEEELDMHEELNEVEQDQFKKLVNSINDGLYERYPFKYF
ncbi:SMI1/KNR4 family protein [Acinetobacter pittii]|uniref:SMI1/KNR4 family protein n=1 Tax=Acinetobacter pittii TaxID=48296 RepID=UPI00192C4316|nr:SMI1/KNR4 family protein [Acinetobacter pittii]MDB0117180.1 SMI1/KNR4 family protein [Acinetobacter baumannii]MDO7196509.1 SMI1/KNR4 family protein [Acinetobacter pittii]MEB6623412.1 SMI1/KNR4 family protein [Acinetobacter pittii]